MIDLKSCRYMPHRLYFYRPAGTSRGILVEKLSYFIEAKDFEGRTFYGECGLLPGLSIDDRPEYESILEAFCIRLLKGRHDTLDLTMWPSIRCGAEILLAQLNSQEEGLIFDNPFYQEGKEIPINGLIWMGEADFMRQQMKEKIDAGFRCIKMKVGALDWNTEKQLLQELRDAGGDSLMIRVDANGAWNWDDATKQKMEFLDSIQVHSIEQPVAVDQRDSMFKLAQWSPVPIALDEELFHYHSTESKAELLDRYAVQYIVLKPSLVGGFAACDEWIDLCKKRNIGYWLTSALESNVALNAIAQYTYDHAGDFYQGLGTGSLYENNIDSPLEIIGDRIRYNHAKPWNYNIIRS